VNEVVLLRGAEVERILQSVVDEKIPASMCYLSKGKWHIAKVTFCAVDSEQLSIIALPSPFQAVDNSCLERTRARPINVQIGQSVGLSVKYEGGKLIFDTKVTDFGLSAALMGGVIILQKPEQIEIVSRRSYFRVRVPEKLQIDVTMWLRRNCKNSKNRSECIGRLVDISAGGLQVAVDSLQKPELREGQYVMVNLTPLPSEAALEFSAQIRNILPTADNRYLCFGLQIVGVEASKQGRETLSRLVGVTELYYELNRSNEGLQRSSQVGLKTKTYVKRCRSEWGCLLHRLP
jgi:c-di-GMP-binding flagellar brake protein YcgR